MFAPVAAASVPPERTKELLVETLKIFGTERISLSFTLPFTFKSNPDSGFTPMPTPSEFSLMCCDIEPGFAVPALLLASPNSRIVLVVSLK